MKGTPLGTNPTSLFYGGLGPGLEPVGGEFQPPFETVYPGGGAHLFTVLLFVFVLKVDGTIGLAINFWARLEKEGCLVIRRRPITQSKIFILKPIVNLISIRTQAVSRVFNFPWTRIRFIAQSNRLCLSRPCFKDDTKRLTPLSRRREYHTVVS